MLARPADTHALDRQLTVVVVALVASFLGIAVTSQRAAREIDALSDSIASNASPSIEQLAAVRAAAQEAELALWRLNHGDRAATQQSVYAALTTLDERVQAYLALPQFPGEVASWREVQRAASQFDAAVRAASERPESRPPEQMILDEVEPAGKRVVDAALRAIEFNAHNGRAIAQQIKETRQRDTLVTTVLAVWCALTAAFGGILLRARTLRRRALVEARTRELEERSNELELFAGRVAHDLRTPLSTARMSLDLLVRETHEETAAAQAARTLRSLERADSIIGGLLDFARSGAKPDPGARTDVRAVLADFAAGMVPTAESLGITLLCEEAPPVLVGCSAGVYLSLLGNLVRNSFKYMGRADVRRVIVRVRHAGTSVLTEVQDTGPGIAPEHALHVFDLYYRVPGSPAGGLGFGLATVKRLVEAHHGTVSLSSRPGEGCTFWFTLPHAGVPEPLAEEGEAGVAPGRLSWAPAREPPWPPPRSGRGN